MIVPRYIVGFSGHRHLAESDQLRQTFESCLKSLMQQVQLVGGVLELYSGIAFGADLIAVESARALGLTVHLILPKPIIHEAESGAVRQDAGFAADFWDVSDAASPKTFHTKDWARAWRQIQDAQAGQNGGTLRVVHGSYSEPECYYDAGMQILEACDVFVTVWDGETAQGLGGTAQLVERARAESPPRPLTIIHPTTYRVIHEHLESFASAEEDQLLRISRLNALIAQYAPGTARSAAEIQRRLDNVAVGTSSKFRTSKVKAIYCQCLATIAAAAAILFPRSDSEFSLTLFGLAGLEMFFVICALLLARVRSHRHLHEQWLRARFGAELARGMECSVYFMDPLGPHFARRVPVWRRFVMSVALLSIPRDTERSQPWQHWRELYATNRLEDQLKFFQKRQHDADAQWRHTRTVGHWATVLAPVFVLIAMVTKGVFVFHPPAVRTSFAWSTFGMDLMVRFMPIVVPLVAGMASGLSAALDLTRRTYRYREMASLLQTSLTQLTATKTGSDARRIVQATEAILLDELIEWRLVERQSGEQ